MGLFGAAQGLGGPKRSPSLDLSDKSYNDGTWQTYTLPKEDPKNIQITWHTPWVLLTLATFSGNQQILLYQEIQI